VNTLEERLSCLDEIEPSVEERQAWLREFWDMSRPAERFAEDFGQEDLVYNAARDFEARLAKFQEVAVSSASAARDHIPVFPTIIGAVQQASAFGCEIREAQDADTLWSVPIIKEYDPDAVMALELPPVDAGLQGESLNLARQLEEYYGGQVGVRLPDMQGPADVAGAVWEPMHLFRAMVEHPEAAHHLIDLSTQLLINLHQAMEATVTELVAPHWPNIWIPPGYGTALSEDFAPMLSPEMYEEFCVPYVNRISDACGGVFIHCCGTFEHNFENLSKLHNLRGINPSIPIVSWEQVLEYFEDVCVLVPGLNQKNQGLWSSTEEGRQWLRDNTPAGTHLIT